MRILGSFGGTLGYQIERMLKNHPTLHLEVVEQREKILEAVSPSNTTVSAVMLEDSFNVEADESLIRQLRYVANSPTLPIIVVSGRGSLETELAMFEVGASDYFHAPIEFPSFEARVISRIVAFHGHKIGQVLRLGWLKMNLLTGETHILNEKFELTPAEHRILHHLFLIVNGRLGTWGELVEVMEQGHTLEATQAIAFDLQEKIAAFAKKRGFAGEQFQFAFKDRPTLLRSLYR